MSYIRGQPPLPRNLNAEKLPISELSTFRCRVGSDAVASKHETMIGSNDTMCGMSL